MKLVCFYFSLSSLQTFKATVFEIHLVVELDSHGSLLWTSVFEISIRFFTEQLWRSTAAAMR